MTKRTIKFNLGRLVATPGALEAMDEAQYGPLDYLARHVMGDWGELDQHDKQANNFALKEGLRILSAYILPTGVKIWIITEADRSSTTILLPEEY